MSEHNKSRKKNHRIVWLLIFIFFAPVNGYAAGMVGFQDDFENVLFNNWTYLTIPTYDGSGQAVHPDVYYNASGWKGYKYWMTMTPYPNTNSDFENPSIVTSNDGYNWEVPPGLTNPIVLPISGYDSDPNLAFKNGTLYLYYREVSSGFDRLKMKSSTNGITWSPEQTALELPNYQLIAPAVVYNSADNLFYLWYVDTGIQGSQATSTQVILRNSNDGIHWSSPQVVPISIPGKIIWHINAEYIPELNEYWMVLSAGTDVVTGNNDLFFAYSIDKLNWNVLPGKILGSGRNWDNYQIYQSAINYINNSVKLWYSASSLSGTWHMGYSETSLTDLKKDYHWEYYNKIGDFYRNSLQVKNGQFSAMLKFDGNVNDYVDVRRKVSDGQNMSSEIDFYDDGNTTGMKLFRVVNNINEMVGIGVWTISSSAFYSYHDKIYTYKITSIPRTVGWHKFRISIQNDKSSTFYIDDINVGALSSQFNDPVYVQLSSGFYKGVFYVDNLNVYQNSEANTIPSITTQPGAQNVQIGQTTIFNVVAVGTFPISYQWQKNGVNISQAYGSSYTTPPVTLADSGSTYRVIVSNAIGSVTSNAAILTVSTTINIVSNGNFESGTTSWLFYTDGTGTFNAQPPGYDGNNAAMLELGSTGTNIQLYQTAITLEPNTRYRLSFAAYSTAGHDVTVRLFQHVSPYTPYAPDFTANLGTGWQTFTTEFNTTDLTGTVSDGRLMFWLADFAAAGDTYCIDSIRLEKVIATPISPVVVGNAPIGTNVPIAARISVNFSKPMNQASAQLAFSTIPATTGSFTWSGNNTTYIPVSNLVYNTAYSVTVGTSAMDSAGNNILSPYTWQFTTVPDTTPPSVIGNTPTGTNVSQAAQVTINFSEAMNKSSAQSAFSTSPATTGSFGWSGNIMTYTPNSNLTYNTTYNVTVGTGSMDSAGNNMLSSYTWRFTTVPDAMPPSVIDTTPTGINISIASRINLTFSEAMNKSSAQLAFSTSPATTGSFGWNGNVMLYTPGSNLNIGTTYTATVGTGAKDLAGNALQLPYNWQFTTATPDIISPVVIGNTPTGIDVPITTQITALFSEAMNKSSVQTAFSTSPATTGIFSWSGNNMTYTPGSNLAFSTTYNVTIGTGAMDLAGNNMSSPNKWAFTTIGQDLTPPAVIRNSPTGTNVSLAARITVNFSEAMNQTSVQSAFSIIPAMTGSFSWIGNNMTYTPVSNLAYNTTYNVIIGTGAKDVAGNSMTSSYTWPFTTYRDTTSPSVIGTTPNGTNVPIISQITVTFSKAMNNVSAESAFSTSPASTGSFSWSGNTLKYTSASNLSYNTTYIVTVGTGARDFAGNNILSSYIWQFVTAPLSINLISNPGFESATASWSFYTSGTGTFSTASPGYEGNNAAMFALSSTGTNIQLYQTGITLEPNTLYRLSFAAYSTTGHDVTVRIIKHVSPYTPYAPDFTANLGTGWQTLTTEFNTTGFFTGTVSDGRLMFWFADFVTPGDTYYIDAIRLEKVIATPPIPPIPPVVVGNAPTGSNVPIASRISVNFSKPMNQASVQSAFSTSPATTGSFSWSGNNLTYIPTSNLAYNTVYIVTVGTGATDSTGNNMLSSYTWTFTTVPDRMPPLVISTIPTGINVSIASRINATFSEAMNKSTAESAFSTFPATTGSFSWIENNMTYTPVSNLAYDTTYNVTVGTGAMDSAGNNMTSSYTWYFTTSRNMTPPSIIGNTPNGTNVPIISQITVTFSKPMNNASAQSAFFTSPATTGSFSWNGNNMTYTPISNLIYNTTYIVTVGTGAIDSAGNNMLSSYTWPFTTVPDTNPPSIIRLAPTGINVSIASRINATFSKAMNKSSTESAFSTYPATTGSFSWSGNNLTYTPSSNLAYGTNYNVTIGTGAMDLEGNNMLSPNEWQFTTIEQDLTPPAVIGNSPTGINVSITSRINVTFSEAMNKSSTESSFSTSPATTGSFSWSGNNMTYIPNSNLAYNTAYIVMVGTGAMDSAGNNMLSSYTWPFTTTPDRMPPLVISTTPTGSNVSIVSRINATFSKAMNKSTVESSFSTLPATTGSFSWIGTNMTFTPVSNLAYNTTYNVIIGTGAKDVEGNNLASTFTWPFITSRDTTPPSVIGTTPNGTNVPLVSQITVTFSKAMNNASAQSAFSTSPATTGSFSWNGNNMTYTPISNLAYNTTYNVTIGTGAIDSTGNNMLSSYSWRFTTVPDTMPPSIFNTSPTGINAAIASGINVTFSEAMNKSTAESSFSTFPATTGSFSWIGNTMTFTPVLNLAYNTTYNVIIGTGAKDSAGNSMTASYTWSFTTYRDTTPPSVIGTTPNGTNVPLVSQITVTFSKAMNNASAQSAFSTSPATTGSFSWSGNTMKYTPASNLSYNTTYIVTVGTGARDLAGNNMSSSYTWQFITAPFSINLINNPGFESATASWTLYTSGTGTFSTASPGFEGNNAAKLTLNSAGTNIQLYQTGTILEPNTRYRLTFSAYSTTGHDMTVRLIKHVSPYTPYAPDFTANLGTSWQTFTTEFNTTGFFTGTVSDGRLMFWFADYAGGGDIYYIDAIRLEKV